MIYSGRESAVPPLGNCPPINAPGTPSSTAPTRAPPTVVPAQLAAVSEFSQKAADNTAPAKPPTTPPISAPSFQYVGWMLRGTLSLGASKLVAWRRPRSARLQSRDGCGPATEVCAEA